MSVDLSPPALNAEQRRSQISGGHRLLTRVRDHPFQLYTEREFATRAVAVDAAYWLDSVAGTLRAAISRTSAARVDAALTRARKRAAEYEVDRAGAAEVVAEALFDGRWFKTRREHVSRPDLRDRVRVLLDRGEPVELVFPIFSRKPLSPVKNRGTAPDAAELHSLARCAALAHTLDALSPTGARLTILADGRKYNRACRTPDAVVLAYQDALRGWIDELGASSVLHVVDYEEWVADGLDEATLAAREIRYAAWTRRLEDTYGELFDVGDLEAGLARIAAHDDVGEQVAFTFWSMVTSLNYGYFARARDVAPRCDEIQSAYAYYISSLRRPLDGPLRRDLTVSGVDSPDTGLLHGELRGEAFGAACRYVAISLTDRDLSVLRTIAPRALKLTIHGKAAELHLVTATSRDANMTAQHATGGYDLSDGEAKPTYRYLLEREALAEIPVLVSGALRRAGYDPRFRTLARMEADRQPIAYVTDPAPLVQQTLHRLLEGIEI